MRYMPTPEPDPEPDTHLSILREVKALLQNHCRGEFCKNILGIAARPSSSDELKKPIEYSVRGAIERVCQLRGLNSRTIHALFPRNTEILSDLGPRHAQALVDQIIARLN